MVRGSLWRLANGFARQLESVLNRTVTNNVKIKAVVPKSSGENLIPVGRDLTKTNMVPSLIPLRLRNETPAAWLDMIFQMCMDESEEYLMVRSSYVAVSADEAGETKLCHFDYERDKPHGYPDAHLQISAESPALRQICAQRDVTHAKLHFPVGGRRFRPSLEDVIEFLIVEELAPGRSGWEAVVEEGRETFQDNQLRAAMRRRPAVVDDYLRKHGAEHGWQRLPKT